VGCARRLWSDIARRAQRVSELAAAVIYHARTPPPLSPLYRPAYVRRSSRSRGARLAQAAAAARRRKAVRLARLFPRAFSRAHRPPGKARRRRRGAAAAASDKAAEAAEEAERAEAGARARAAPRRRGARALPTSRAATLCAPAVRTPSRSPAPLTRPSAGQRRAHLLAANLHAPRRALGGRTGGRAAAGRGCVRLQPVRSSRSAPSSLLTPPNPPTP